MPDQFTTTTTTGYGQRIIGSFFGILFGILLFFGSFVLLYWNEGRIDVSSIARTQTVAVSPSSVDTSANGKGVSVTGEIASNEILGDNLFLKPANYISIQRMVEMYSWVENVENKSTTNPGGSQTTQTTYTYVKNWQENPPDSSTFSHPEGHINPSKPYSSDSFYVSSANIGAYGISPASMYPPTSDIQLTIQDTLLPSNGKIDSNYIFIPVTASSSLSSPYIGDIRIKYTVLKPGTSVTAFGKLDQSNIVPYYFNQNNSLYRLTMGTRDEGIAQMHSEYSMSLWLFRLLGFIMMFMGLNLIFGPISVLLDILPIFGEISRGLISLIIFLVAIVLTIVTIIVSMIAHSIIALAISVLVVLIALIVFARWKRSSISIPSVPPSAPPVQ